MDLCLRLGGRSSSVLGSLNNKKISHLRKVCFIKCPDYKGSFLTCSYSGTLGPQIFEVSRATKLLEPLEPLEWKVSSLMPTIIIFCQSTIMHAQILQFFSSSLVVLFLTCAFSSLASAHSWHLNQPPPPPAAPPPPPPHSPPLPPPPPPPGRLQCPWSACPSCC